jgi:hypothetical protein
LSNKKTIQDLQKDVAKLGKKKTVEKLNAEQIARLEKQNDSINTLRPDIDCSTL